MDANWYSTSVTPAANVRRRAVSIASADRSTPTTLPEGPTTLAASRQTSPPPHPRSSTRMPVVIPARCSSSNVASFQYSACRTSRCNSR